jgi:glycosyltransferase involved in cell wall biosynthesis
MQVTYTAPNRSHHYKYALALARAGCLHRFVSGFSRFGPGAALPELGNRLLRADHLQNFYLASLRLRAPAPVSEELAYLSKIWLDRLSTRPARASDIFLFYNGAGLHTSRRLGAFGAVRVVEAVNSHVLEQRKLMREEHRLAGLPPPRFHRRETNRRVEEYAVADAVLCPSGFVKESFVRRGFPNERIFVVPYGLSLPETITGTEALPAGDGTFRVLYVGQVSPRKGLRYLLSAFARLRHPRKELVIVGPMGEPSGIEDVSTPSNTVFRGVLKGEALAQAYREASVFVLPTVEEGLALVLGEALSFGLPVIATNHSGAEDLFESGREGFIVPIRDPNAIAEKLQHLADDPALRQRMSAAAREKARTLRGWESTGQKLVETLSALAEKRRAGAI